MFNALKYTQELEQAGFSREQAEISVKVLIEVMNDNFATKSDLKELELKLVSAIDSNVLRLESQIRELDYKLTIKLGAMLTVAVGLMATFQRLFQTLH